MEKKEELYNKLKILLQDKILKLDESIKTLEKQESISSDIHSFLTQYQSGIFATDLLSNFFSELGIGISLDTYVNTYSLLQYLKSNGSFWQDQVNQCEKLIQNLIQAIEKKEHSIMQKRGANNYKILDNKKELEFLESIHNSIDCDHFTMLFNQQYSKHLLEFLKQHNFTSEEILFFTMEITKSNSILAEKNINMLLMERKRKAQIQREKEQKEIEKKRDLIKRMNEQTKVSNIGSDDDPTPSNLDTPSIIEQGSDIEEVSDEQSTSVVESQDTLNNSVDKQTDIIFSPLNEEEANLYERIRSLISQSVHEDHPIFQLSMAQLNDNTILQSRLFVYHSVSDLDIREEVIISDLKNHIFPMFSSNLSDEQRINLIDSATGILSFYDELKNKQKQLIEQANKSFLTCLEEFGFVQEQNYCIELQNFIIEADKLLNSKNSKKLDAKKLKDLQSGLTKLKSNIDFFGQSVKLYCIEEQSAENKECMDIYLGEIQKCHADIQQTYASLSKEELELICLKYAEEFYNEVGNVQAFIVFPEDNDELVSNFEKDILSNHSLTFSNYGSIISKLKEKAGMVFSDTIGSNRDHKVKSEHYSEEVLKKFRVKSIHDGSIRIFYSDFHTTLHDLSNTHPVSLFFAHYAGYGSVSGNQKKKINDTALTICWHNRDDIEKVTNLFQTDWKSLDSYQTDAKKRQIDEYLRKQNIKLGHLIYTYLSLKEERKKQNGK